MNVAVAERPVPWLPIFTAVCALLVVIGSFAPWARVVFITVNGTDGDGVLTMILGIAAGIGAVVRIARPAAHRWLAWMLLVLFGLAAAIAIYDWANLSRVTDDDAIFKIEVGWGLPVLALSALAGAVLALIQGIRPVAARLPSLPAAVEFAPAGPAAQPRRAAFCGSCGAALEGDEAFCAACGARTA